jgi:predicted HTH transcriptional regulator
MKAEELIAILRQGEGIRVEFKSDFPANAQAVGKEMAALANTGGGILLWGFLTMVRPLVSRNPNEP